MGTAIRGHTETNVGPVSVGTVGPGPRLAQLEGELQESRDALAAAQRELDRWHTQREELQEERKRLQAERLEAVRAADAAGLAKIDRRLPALARELEIAAGQVENAERARLKAREQVEARRAELERARQRARELPRIVRQQVVYAMQRSSEADEAERQTRVLRAGADRAAAQADALRAEYKELTGTPLDVKVG